ncbi:nucleotide-binding oligomerization domain-containing protein 1-like [Chanodichthys erythropterus]|uniref:nucleotide-binding oligomerization domain-containing protein 1-like n=1 Tax=Chanodichthys erythropterus TaxID=933992 RepID=UPI00351DEF3E
MACAQHCAAKYLRNHRIKLVTQMRNLPLIIENLYQQKVFNDHEVDALKAERTEFDKARSILDWVINKGEAACYELLRILDATQKRTLHPDLHYWICCFPFRVEDTEITYSFGTRPCQNYQTELKKKAESILKDQREHCGKYLGDEGQVNFHFLPLVLETDSEGKTPQCKIKWKNKKCKKLRPKKLRSYIPNVEKAFSPEDLLKCQDKNILLIGKPGIGKTTVVQEMMRLWAEKHDKDLDYMFYFDESVLSHSSRVVSLESILFDVYLKPMENDRKEVFQDIEENSENVVIVFDGVVDLEENSTLWKIMKHELLPDAKIIITCRSEVEYDPLFSSWPTRKVYVQGFSEESINTYYKSMLGHDPVLLDVVLKNQELFSLSHVPMYAFMIVDLIQYKNDVFTHPHTVTEMYIHIFRVAVKKHGKKKIYQIDKYLKEIKDQINFLMKNAFGATMQKCLNLPDVSSDETDICHAFLKMITTRDSPTSATTYCAFLHNTMQEFFSALWLLECPSEIEKVLQLCQTEENKHMKHVLPFICGLLGEHNIKLLKCLFPEDQIKKTSDWFIEKFLDTFLQLQSESEEFDLLYVCQCLYELQSPKACLMFLEKMEHQLEPEGDLDPHQCCALAYVIGRCGEKEVYLDLEDCNVTDAGMEMMLSCSPKIRLKIWEDPLKQILLFQEFFHKLSQCSCSFFDLRARNNRDLRDFLLDLCSHVKNYETQTGRSFLPALQSVFQSPDVWIIDLSQRKTSVLLEVLKLQTEKKPVELRGCSEEESEMKSFLQCVPYISQLRFSYLSESVKNRFLLRLFIKAAETETQTGEQMMKLLTSVCAYEYFPYQWGDIDAYRDFLLDLYSHVKNYETQTGRSFLPALQSVFQSLHIWIIDLSQRKTSVLLEVLKLQTEKKPVDLRGCSEEESEMMSFLQCLPYISQLSVDCRLIIQLNTPKGSFKSPAQNVFGFQLHKSS